MFCAVYTFTSLQDIVFVNFYLTGYTQPIKLAYYVLQQLV